MRGLCPIRLSRKFRVSRVIMFFFHIFHLSTNSQLSSIASQIAIIVKVAIGATGPAFKILGLSVSVL